MKDEKRVLKLVTPLSFAVCLLLMAPLSQADMAATKQQYENCIAGQIPIERAKSSPKASNVLSACNSEFTAFVQQLPPGASADFRHMAERHIKKQLKK